MFGLWKQPITHMLNHNSRSQLQIVRKDVWQLSALIRGKAAGVVNVEHYASSISDRRALATGPGP